MKKRNVFLGDYFAKWISFSLALFVMSCSRAPDTDEHVEPEPEDAVGVLDIQAKYSESGPQAEDARFTVKSEAGDVIAERTRRTTYELPAGKYSVTATLRVVEREEVAHVRAGERTTKTIIMDSGILNVEAVLAEGGDPVDSARFSIVSAEKDIRGRREELIPSTRRSMFDLPSGTFLVRAHDDAVTVEKEVEIRAGERADEVIVLNAGMLVARALYENGDEVTDRVFWEVLSAEKDIRGNRSTVASSHRRGDVFRHLLPAGAHLLRAGFGEREIEKDIVVEAGSQLEVDVVFPE